jgi:hypothetical protein
LSDQSHVAHRAVPTIFLLSSEKTLELTNALAINLFQGVIMTKRAIIAAALAAGLLVQTPGFTQVPITPSASTAADPATMSDPEKEARKTWHAVMRNIPVPGKGCFHASYPNVAWESVECKEAKPRSHPVSLNPKLGVPQEVGAVGGDYTANSQGLISVASGSFQTSGITTETGVRGDSGAVDGSNEYSLQINTNQGNSDRCSGHPNCWVWQQFVYATDTQQGKGALFIQYWLLFWNATCPQYWNHSTVDGITNCWKNSKLATPPNIPVTNLGELVLTGSAVPGGYDYVELEYADDIWSISAEDEVLGIGYVWNQAEFNVFGNGGGSQAYFNDYPSITVLLALRDGSASAPQCRGGWTGTFSENGVTAESNNLNLGTTCQTGYFLSPYIEFTENIPVPSTPCSSCGGGGVRPSPPPIKE